MAGGLRTCEDAAAGVTDRDNAGVLSRVFESGDDTGTGFPSWSRSENGSDFPLRELGLGR